MAELAKIERFTSEDLDNLRHGLLKAKMDSWQVADMVSSFLAGRGYGVDNVIMREAAHRLAIPGKSHESMQALLETVAYVM
jgi:hypothetical protein